jgi:hypothetical protein
MSVKDKSAVETSAAIRVEEVLLETPPKVKLGLLKFRLQAEAYC